jgi:hypothetical protein
VQHAARDPVPGGVLHGAALDAFVAGARPATDATLAGTGDRPSPRPV